MSSQDTVPDGSSPVTSIDEAEDPEDVACRSLDHMSEQITQQILQSKLCVEKSSLAAGLLFVGFFVGRKSSTIRVDAARCVGHCRLLCRNAMLCCRFECRWRQSAFLFRFFGIGCVARRYCATRSELNTSAIDTNVAPITLAHR
jgi:hypothetical protein